MNKLNITWAYPDILNLHGDRGNIMAFDKIAHELNLQTNIKRIDTFDEKIDFENTDILFFNPGQLKEMPSIISALEGQKDELDNYIESGKMIIIIGTTGCIMANNTIRVDNSEIKGLGYLDMECMEREIAYGNDLHFSLEEDKNIEIIGSQIQMIDTKLNSDIKLGNVLYGMGNNNDNCEGAKYKNVIFTNCLGPVFVKNPWYAEYLIRKVFETKKESLEEKNIDYSLEKNSFEAIKEYIREKE